MTIVSDVSLPTDAFILGTVFEHHPGTHVELDHVVPVESDDVLPYFWLTADDDETVAGTLRSLRGTESLHRLAENRDSVLFEASWAAGKNRAGPALKTGHSGCLAATGTSEGWDLQMRFADNETLVAFNQALTEQGISVTLTRVAEFTADPGPAQLSAEQREALALADRHGYFEVPRACTISDLAAKAGISNSAFSERLRRGVAGLVSGTDEVTVPNH